MRHQIAQRADIDLRSLREVLETFARERNLCDQPFTIFRPQIENLHGRRAAWNKDQPWIPRIVHQQHAAQRPVCDEHGVDRQSVVKFEIAHGWLRFGLAY